MEEMYKFIVNDLHKFQTIVIFFNETLDFQVKIFEYLGLNFTLYVSKYLLSMRFYRFEYRYSI